MGKFVRIEYDDVKKLSDKLKKRVNNIDNMFERIAENAMENTLNEAEKRTPIQTGELKSSWKKDVEKPKRKGNTFSQTATNKAYNELADSFGMDAYYAEYVEEGNKRPAPYYADSDGRVHWITRPEGVHMLANAEIDTERKLPKIIENEFKKFLGGLFD